MAKKTNKNKKNVKQNKKTYNTKDKYTKDKNIKEEKLVKEVKIDKDYEDKKEKEISKKNNTEEKKKLEYKDIEFEDPIEVTLKDLGIDKRFNIRKELYNIKIDIQENKGRNIKLIWISILMILASIVMVGVYLATENGGDEVKAIVSDVIETTSGDGKYVEYYQAKLVYEYKEEKYKDIIYKDAEPSLFIGDEVTIKVNPKNPKQIYSNKKYIIIAAVLAAMGVILFIGHFYMAWRKIYLSEENE